jgi:uncharacterized protein (UPF0335 family)
MTEASTKLARDQLKAFIERLDEERKAVGDDRKAVFAEAKSQGFDPKAMRRMLKRRKAEPAELAEEEAIDAVYLSALGMAEETPLHEYVRALAGDGLGRDELIEAFQRLIPNNGEIIARVGGKPMKLWRDEAGEAFAAEYVAPAPRAERPGRDLDSEAVEETVDGRKDHIRSAADRAERRARGAAK